MADGSTAVFLTCHNCGGSGNYPSAMIPPGKCRLYCWQNRDEATYGKLPVEVERFVKRQQAADRKQYRDKVRWELDAPARAERERQAAEQAAQERAEQEAQKRDEMERKAISQYEGVVGERMEVAVTVTGVSEYEAVPFRSFSGWTVTRYIIRMRTASGNVLVWFSDYPKKQGDWMRIRATVKKHNQYQGERQTTVQRVKEIDRDDPASC
jgi:hypothetical protein